MLDLRVEDLDERITLKCLVITAFMTAYAVLTFLEISYLREQVEQIHAAQVLTNENLGRIEKQSLTSGVTMTDTEIQIKKLKEHVGELEGLLGGCEEATDIDGGTATILNSVFGPAVAELILLNLKLSRIEDQLSYLRSDGGV